MLARKPLERAYDPQVRLKAMVTAAALMGLLALGRATTAAGVEEPPMCHGHRATIVGTAGNDGPAGHLRAGT